MLRYMEGGQVGSNFMMTEEDYDIHRLASMWFFMGPRGDTKMTFVADEKGFSQGIFQ